jgi:hypothetical protein
MCAKQVTKQRTLLTLEDSDLGVFHFRRHRALAARRNVYPRGVTACMRVFGTGASNKHRQYAGNQFGVHLQPCSTDAQVPDYRPKNTTS